MPFWPRLLGWVVPAHVAIPFGLDQRRMPTGSSLNVLLPECVGGFQRKSGKSGGRRDQPTYAHYRDGDAAVFVELGIFGSPSAAQLALDTARAEFDAEFPGHDRLLIHNGDVSCLRTRSRLGSLLAWTRGGYYFSVHAPRGDADLDRFVRDFPF